jgi:hypothetical protein
MFIGEYNHTPTIKYAESSQVSVKGTCNIVLDDCGVALSFHAYLTRGRVQVARNMIEGSSIIKSASSSHRVGCELTIVVDRATTTIPIYMISDKSYLLIDS